MKRIALLMVVLLGLTFLLPASADTVQRNGFLDTAFSVLEKDNIFQVRYNQLTGAEIESVFELGVPYFFGGKYPKTVFMHYPDYAMRDCWQTTQFFKKGQFYVFGFDCAGFTSWIFTENRLPKHDSLSNLITQYYQYRDHTLFSHRPGKEPPPFDQLKDYLKVGDLLITRGTYNHSMMYIGTLRDYHFTAKEVPALADYLDYPLVIHCGTHPDFGDRFQALIDSNPERYGACKTTDGGVCVSIVGVPYEKATHSAHVQLTDFYWFELEGGYKLTIRNYDPNGSFLWYRHKL